MLKYHDSLIKITHMYKCSKENIYTYRKIYQIYQNISNRYKKKLDSKGNN